MKKEKKRFESYAGITYQDCWNMDLKLSEIIATHLRAFLQAEKSGPGGYPGIFYSIYGREDAYREWLSILREMIAAFDSYSASKFNPEKREQEQEKIDEGMQLFVKYFSYL